jgi:hypothetical protein
LGKIFPRLRVSRSRFRKTNPRDRADESGQRVDYFKLNQIINNLKSSGAH